MKLREKRGRKKKEPENPDALRVRAAVFDLKSSRKGIGGGTWEGSNGPAPVWTELVFEVEPGETVADALRRISKSERVYVFDLDSVRSMLEKAVASGLRAGSWESPRKTTHHLQTTAKTPKG